MYIIVIALCIHVLGALGAKDCENLFNCEFAQKENIPPCRCDDLCISFKDCCKNFIGNINSTSKQRDDIKSSQTCIPLTKNTKLKSDKIGAFMVDKCNDSIPCNVTDDLDTTIPVSTKKTTFRNADCARCNGVFEFDRWSLVYEMANHIYSEILKQNAVSDIPQDRNKKLKTFLYPPDHISPRFCYSDLVQTLDSTDLTSHQNPVSCDEFTYRSLDECSKDQCCNNETSYTCVILMLLDYREVKNTNSRNPNVRPLQVVFQPTKETEERITSSKLSMNIKYKKIKIFIDLEDNFEQDCEPCKWTKIDARASSKLMVDCVYGIITFLGMTKYKLYPARPECTYDKPGNSLNRTIFDVVMQSSVLLNSYDLDALMRFNTTLSCRDPHFDQVVKGNIQTVAPNISAFSQSGRFYIKSFKATFLDNMTSCHDISLLYNDERHFQIACLKREIESIPNVSFEKGLSWLIFTLVIIASIQRDI